MNLWNFAKTCVWFVRSLFHCQHKEDQLLQFLRETYNQHHQGKLIGTPLFIELMCVLHKHSTTSESATSSMSDDSMSDKELEDAMTCYMLGWYIRQHTNYKTE